MSRQQTTATQKTYNKPDADDSDLDSDPRCREQEREPIWPLSPALGVNPRRPQAQEHHLLPQPPENGTNLVRRCMKWPCDIKFRRPWDILVFFMKLYLTHLR